MPEETYGTKLSETVLPVEWPQNSKIDETKWKETENLCYGFRKAKNSNLSDAKISEIEYLNNLKIEGGNISQWLKNYTGKDEKFQCIRIINTLHNGIRMSQDNPELLREQTSLLNGNIDTIDHILKSRILYNNNSGLEALLNVTMDIIQFGDTQDIQETALKLLSNNSHNFYNLRETTEAYRRFEAFSQNYPVLGDKLKQMQYEKQTSRIAASLAAKLFYKEEKEKMSEEELLMIRSLNYSFTEEEMQSAQEQVDKLLKDSNLDVELMNEAWRMSSEDRPRIAYEKNISAIMQLESLVPGICEELYNKFGICNFGRYPVEMLIKQYEQRNDKDLKYGIAVYPYNDHNGFFYNQDPIRKIYNTVSEKGYGIRIIETDTLRKLYRQLIFLDSTYGENNKISFAFLGGHGNTSAIQFSKKIHIDKIIGDKKYAHYLGVLFTADITNSLAIQREKIQRYFINNPTIILNSCSTGAEEGIAKALSEKLKSKVIAPKVNLINILDVLHSTNDEGMDLDVVYENNNYETEDAVIYDNRVREKWSNQHISRS